ncbi:MAG: dephospho-CoA kinase [Denitromonas halophila]|uniref:Dephospho-CoA kinase n=2 Tax=Denitromonas TaxID=139331 RepID=A0A557RI24_9RHOO|nr:dephospho-CoA kinase [Denitromonas ohlonensis]TVO70389.1 dephospho-CoA kinase [Denitromonas ohlonensis]TVT47014.1 MAG: dephospho-CoA kinase [Denitromonas halophila]TVT66118.1 MAG: dephospho-CoA kinase [Denitromonas halophila]TVT69939.1 MAG: dephospho-CoA kinase [Denitromonas halophila]
MGRCLCWCHPRGLLAVSATRWIVGLTGGIGSGKSAASDRFGECGAAIVDTDLIARQLTAPGGAAVPAIRDAFGDALISADGALDRDAMRARVFAHPAERQRLEAILHPMIRAESDRQCAEADAPYVVLVVPLLIESGTYRQRCQRIAVVDCEEAVQVARVMRRSGLPPAQVEAIMAAQLPRADRLAAADDVIDNSGDLDHLHRQVDALHQRYLALASA